jgi:hypothetical protein
VDFLAGRVFKALPIQHLQTSLQARARDEPPKVNVSLARHCKQAVWVASIIWIQGEAEVKLCQNSQNPLPGCWAVAGDTPCK